jgi:tetratricopeptide (TPR) repeat protein
LYAWAGYVKKRELEADRGRFAFDPRCWTLDYYLALVFFALGLLSKSMLVTLPFVLLLLDYWPLDRLASEASHSRLRTCLNLILEKVPFLLLSAAICVITVLTQKNAVVIGRSSTFFWRVGNAMLAYTDYLEHMIYPVGLTVAYSHSGTNPSLWNVGLSVLILVAISTGALAARRKHPCLVVGWLWCLGMFLPVIDIMQAGQNARADRYTYLPQIGLYVMMTWGAMELCAHWRHRRAVLGFGAVAILAGLLAGAYVQTSYWKDSVTLWTRALACKSDYSFVHNTLGSALFNQGKSAEAILHFKRALQFEPDYPEAHVNLGIALATQGKQEEAIQQYKQALHFNPYSSAAHYNLGDMLASQGKQEEAIRHFERALQLRPDYLDAQYDLGLALANQGKWSEAIQHFEPALHVKLDDTDARYILAVALSTHQKWAEAIELYERVLQVKPDFAEAHNYLGIALASQGKLVEAKTQFQQALTLATAQGNATLAESIRTRLKSSTSASPPSQNP